MHSTYIEATNTNEEMHIIDHFAIIENQRNKRDDHINSLEVEDRLRVQNLPSENVIDFNT